MGWVGGGGRGTPSKNVRYGYGSRGGAMHAMEAMHAMKAMQPMKAMRAMKMLNIVQEIEVMMQSCEKYEMYKII